MIGVWGRKRWWNAWPRGFQTARSCVSMTDGSFCVKPDIGATVEAVRRLVPMLLDQGFEFETVTRLLCQTTSSNAFSR